MELASYIFTRLLHQAPGVAIETIVNAAAVYGLWSRRRPASQSSWATPCNGLPAARPGIYVGSVQHAPPPNSVAYKRGDLSGVGEVVRRLAIDAD